MDFHDFTRVIGKSGCPSHPPPKVCAGPDAMDSGGRQVVHRGDDERRGALLGEALAAVPAHPTNGQRFPIYSRMLCLSQSKIEWLSRRFQCESLLIVDDTEDKDPYPIRKSACFLKAIRSIKSKASTFQR